MKFSNISIAVIISVIGFVVFSPSLFGQFIWDDYAYIIQNKLFVQSNGLYLIWFSKSATDPWPMSYSLLYLLRHLFGEQPVGYHVTAILLHSLNSFLIFLVLKKLNFKHALWASLLFLVHPMNTDSVAWIFQIKTLFGLTWAALAILSYLSGWGAVATVGLFALSLLAKPIFICLPIFLLLVLLWQKRDLKSNFAILVSSFAVSGLIFLLNSWWYKDVVLSEPTRTDGWLGRILGVGWAGLFYIQQSYFPVNLSFIYPRWEFPHLTTWNWLPTVIFLAAITAIFLSRKKMPQAVFLGLTFWLVNIIPVLGFHDIHFMRFSLVADHWQYPALIGLIIPIACFPFRRPWTLGSFFLAFALLTYFHARDYRTEESLYRQSLAQNPGSAILHDLLGLGYIRSSELDKAKFHFEESLKIKPSAQAYFNRAIIYHARGDMQNASLNYANSDLLNPENAKNLSNWGVALLNLGQTEAAIDKFKRAIELLPEEHSYHFNLALAYDKVPSLKAQAQLEYKKAAELKAILK